MTFLSLETPRLLLVLQSHSAVSILSSWHCSIMHLPVHSLLSANVLSGSYISRNNGGGEWMGACYCTWNRKKAGNGHFCLQAQLASEIKEWKLLPPTHFFILLFGFLSLAWHSSIFYSNSFYCRTSWAGNGNPYANGRLCVITVFWGCLSKS